METEKVIQWILIIVGAILFIIGFVGMSPEITTREDVGYLGTGLTILGTFFITFGVVYPYAEIWREKKVKQQEFFCPYCGKTLKFSLTK
ncbi:MAG: hypothetical protein ACFFC7_33020 [Candidatus Hermodarchaeota archaeon]